MDAYLFPLHTSQTNISILVNHYNNTKKHRPSFEYFSEINYIMQEKKFSLQHLSKEYNLNSNTYGDCRHHRTRHRHPLGIQPLGMGSEDPRLDIRLPERGMLHFVGLPHLDPRHRHRSNGSAITKHYKRTI